MTRANSIRIKAIAVVMGVAVFLFFFVAVAAKYLAGFPWEVFRVRGHVIAVVILGTMAVGFLQIWFRLRPLEAYYRAREKGEPVPPDISLASFQLAYGFPASAAVIMFLLLIFATMTVVMDLVVKVGLPWTDAVMIPLPTMVYFVLAGVIIFYSLKRLFRPVLLDLAADNPDLLLGYYDRTYPFPIFPTPFKYPVRLYLPLIVKIFVSMAILGMVGVLFFAMGIRELGRVGTGADPGSSLASIKNFFVYLLWIQIAFSLIITILLSYLVAQEVSNPVKEIISAAEAIVQGDRSARARVVSEDELGVMAAAVNRMATDLVKGLEGRLERLTAVIQSSEKLATRLQGISTDILGVMDEVSSGATNQRSSVEEAGVKADDLGQSAGVIAKHARQIESLANEALKACENGSFTVQQMVTTMDLLRGKAHESANEMKALLLQAKKVLGVVALIDEISDQVNLISLNAALEAAGAGEAGRRFNVVAEEITRLAERTVESTRQVSGLIEQVIGAAEKVSEFSESGKSLADQSLTSSEEVGTFLVSLFQQVEEVTHQVLGITGSTEQQTASALSLSERLRGIEESAMQVEASVLEIQASLTELDRVTAALSGAHEKGAGD